MAFANGSTIGANLSGTSDGTTALFGVNTMILGSGDSEWIYVQVQDTLTTGACVVVATNGSAKGIVAGLTPNAGSNTAGSQLAFCQGSFTAGDYGWVARRGNGVYVLVSGVSTIGGPLYNSATSGTLTTASATATIGGVSLITAAATATGVACLAFVTWPRLLTTGY